MYRADYVANILCDLEALEAPDQEMDRKLERMFNTSSIHDDMLDRPSFPADPLTSDPSAYDKWADNNMSRLTGYKVVGMVLDEVKGEEVWKVTVRSPSGERIEASHKSLAIAKCLVGVKVVLRTATNVA